MLPAQVVSGSQAQGRRGLLSKECQLQELLGAKSTKKGGEEREKIILSGGSCLVQQGRHTSFQFCFLYHIHHRKNSTRFKRWLSNLKPPNLQLPIPAHTNEFGRFKSFYPLLSLFTGSHDFAWCKPASPHRNISTSTKLLLPRLGTSLSVVTRPHPGQPHGMFVDSLDHHSAP